MPWRPLGLGLGIEQGALPSPWVGNFPSTGAKISVSCAPAMSELTGRADHDPAKGALAAFLAAALSVAGAIAVLGLVGLLLSGLIHDEALRQAVGNVAAIIFAIGLVQVVSDAWLHSRLTASFLTVVGQGQSEIRRELTKRFGELEQALEIDQRLLPSGVRAVERGRTEWDALMASADTVVLVPLDLGPAWRQEEWDAAIRCARARRLDVDVYLPNVRGPNAGAHSLHLGYDSVRLEQDLRDNHAALLADWTDGAVSSGSKLRIFTYDRPAGYGLVLGDSAWAMILPPAGGPVAGAARVVVTFRDGTDPGFREAAGRQLGTLDASLLEDAVA